MLYSDTFFLAAREKKTELQMERIRAMYLPQTRGQENGTCEKGLHHGPGYGLYFRGGGGGVLGLRRDQAVIVSCVCREPKCLIVTSNIIPQVLQVEDHVKKTTICVQLKDPDFCSIGKRNNATSSATLLL